MTDETPLAPAAAPPRNPALQSRDFLVGHWELALSNASFLPDPSVTVSSRVAFEWVPGGAFLVLHMGGKPTGAPAATWLISRDESAANYTVLYYDARRVSRVYAMSFEDRVWTIWRESTGFWQRFEGIVNADGRRIAAHWERSPDGATWEHDFDVAYTKLD